MDEQKEGLTATLGVKVKPSTLKSIAIAAKAHGTDKAGFVREAIDEKIRRTAQIARRLDELTEQSGQVAGGLARLEATVQAIARALRV